MNYRVLVSKQENNGYLAVSMDLPHCQVVAPTRETALAQIQSAISDLLIGSEIVDLEVPAPGTQTSMTETFGSFQHDPTFAAFLEEVAQYRAERDLPLSD